MHGVVFLVFDGVKMLDVTGPAEVFAEANRFGADHRVTGEGKAGRVNVSEPSMLPRHR